MSQGENSKNAPTWWRCDTHGPGKMSAWGCPECVREMRDELRQLRSEAEALRQAERKASDEPANKIKELEQQLAQALAALEAARAINAKMLEICSNARRPVI